MAFFTEDEKRVLLFLSIFAFSGLFLSWLNKRYAPASSVSRSIANLGKINLNTVDKDSLIKLPGIGERLAQRIIEYRKEKPFDDMQELKEIKGMNEYRIQKIKDYIYIK
jgi:competence protein ComEA